MTKVQSVHIGLNCVDPGHYNGWRGTLKGCINDANAMREIADSFGYPSTILLDEEATAGAVQETIRAVALNLEPGGFLLLTYSGHGGQLKDPDGSEEDDKKDETWVLYDRQLLDDELNGLWSQFRPGVRVFVLSDSCHSGSVTKLAPYLEIMRSFSLRKSLGLDDMTEACCKALPDEVAERTYAQNKTLYDGLKKRPARSGPVQATVLLISACQDPQVALDGARNGLFTERLLKTWDNGTFSGTYKEFWHQIQMQMPPTQTPNYSLIGPPDPSFEASRPFAFPQ